MRGWLVTGAAAAGLLALPATSSAATLAVVPKKACYRGALRSDPNAERVFVGGTGFTPGSPAEFTLDRRSLGFTLPANAQGQVAGVLALGLVTRERHRLLAATDQSNPGNFGTLSLLTTPVSVSIRPHRARPGERVRIKAAGFTGSKRLYAHIRGRRYHRTVGIGRLRGACGKLSRRRSLIPQGVRPGSYHVQFDGRRRYSKATVPRIRYRFRVFRRRLRR